MSEELIPAVPGQRHVQVSVSLQTGGPLAITMETLVVVANGEDPTKMVNAATSQLLNALPVKEVERIEKAMTDQDDDIITKEPHPTFLKLINEITKLNKNLEKSTGGIV